MPSCRSGCGFRAGARTIWSACGPTAATSGRVPAATVSLPASETGASDMTASLEFLLRLLEQVRPPLVAHEDFGGEHGEFLRACQEAAFLSREPGVHPVPS